MAKAKYTPEPMMDLIDGEYLQEYQDMSRIERLEWRIREWKETSVVKEEPLFRDAAHYYLQYLELMEYHEHSSKLPLHVRRHVGDRLKAYWETDRSLGIGRGKTLFSADERFRTQYRIWTCMAKFKTEARTAKEAEKEARIALTRTRVDIASVNNAYRTFNNYVERIYEERGNLVLFYGIETEIEDYRVWSTDMTEWRDATGL